jgi:sec-independent protein translocase protein TatA
MPGNIGPLEIVVVLIIALVVFGPRRLPELGNSLGRGIREFRDTVSGEKRDHAKALDGSGANAPAEKPSEAEVAHDPPR